MDFVITRHCSQSDILESGATIGLFDLPLPRHRNLFTPCIQQFATSLPPLLWQYVWKPSALGIIDPAIWSYVVVQSDLEWIEFRWMYFKWFEFWQLQFMWFEFKQCSSEVVQNRAMWIQVRVVLPSDLQVGSHILIIRALPIVGSELQAGHSSCRSLSYAFGGKCHCWGTLAPWKGQVMVGLAHYLPDRDYTKLIYYLLGTWAQQRYSFLYWGMSM